MRKVSIARIHQSLLETIIPTNGQIDFIQEFFEIFSISEPITPGGDLGLEPPVAEKIIKLFGGSVMVENLNPPGVQFNVRLKMT